MLTSLAILNQLIPFTTYRILFATRIIIGVLNTIHQNRLSMHVQGVQMSFRLSPETLIAVHQIKRIAFAIEMIEYYCKRSEYFFAHPTRNSRRLKTSDKEARKKAR